MNQDHVNNQPAPDEYDIGGPSDFAEDVHPSKGTWEAEYANGQVKRNEIGMPEMRNDKTATEVEMVKKASLAVAVARAMLKSASSSAIEDQASRLMKLADEDLVETYKALVANDDSEEDQEQDGQDKQAQQQADQDQVEAQDKQGGELPPALKKFNEEKAEKAEDKDQGDKKAQSQQQGQQDQGKQAQMDQQAQMQQMMAQVQQMQQMLAQMQQQGQSTQQVMAQSQQQQQSEQDQGKQAQACMQQPTADDQVIDQMLAQQEPVMSDMGIEMDAPSMDTGDFMMTEQDDVMLSQIFATEETEAQQAQQQGQKQAHAVRTAATRTVGTRPSQGVSGLGGLSASKGESDLSSIWSSAPDVRDAFGIR
jgi:hypothetical protein